MGRTPREMTKTKNDLGVNVPARISRKFHLRSASTMGTAEAKMHFSSLVEMVTLNERPVTITKRGKALVRIVPVDSKPASQEIFGCMKGTAKATGDIVGSEPDEWEALQ